MYIAHIVGELRPSGGDPTSGASFMGRFPDVGLQAAANVVAGTLCKARKNQRRPSQHPSRLRGNYNFVVTGGLTLNCPKCYGRGRIVFEAHVGIGRVLIPNITHIERCDMCHSTGKLYCCEGERGDVLLAVGEMKDGTTVVMEAMEVNPNEAG